MVRVRGCDGFCSFVFIDCMLSLYGSGCVSFGGDVHKYDGPWQGQGFIKWVVVRGVYKMSLSNLCVLCA